MTTLQMSIPQLIPLAKALPNPANVTNKDSAESQAPSTASQKRALHPLFVPTWSLRALLPKLPLAFPIQPDLPPSPKTHYRSHYRYIDPEPLLDPTQRANLSDFQIALYLIDFSPLERVLAPIYVPSLKGQVPFHPVSLFLAICLRREQNLPWSGLARLIAGEDGPNWRRLFGFEGETPSASGLRYFFNAVGAAVFDELCPRSVTLLRQHGLFSETSTYPGDPPTRGITVSQDGMLHRARSRPSCELAEDSCYQPPSPSAPTTPPDSAPPPASPPPPDSPAPPAPPDSPDSPDRAAQPAPTSVAARPCRARQHGLPGCACDTPACQEQCQRASRLDPEARLIHYAGHNHKRGANSQAKGAKTTTRSELASPSRGVNLFGERSVADRSLDDRWAAAWNLQSSLYSANTDERTIFTARLSGLRAKYPDLKIGEWLDDSGVGYGDCLEAIWQLGALRMVDIRADPSDSDPEACLKRGYDGQGWPLCCHGYRMRPNGHDHERRRAKYVCAQLCRREPLRQGEAVQPIEGCPYLDETKPLGCVVNVGKTLPDGTIRLAREIPYGSEAWKARYGRRNLSESRNGQIEGMGLKRLKSYGLSRNTKEVQLADFLLNLHTLGRLVREATNLQVT